VAIIGHAVSGASTGYFPAGRQHFGAATGIVIAAQMQGRKSQLAF
jgi:hypothetical protein